MAFLQHQCLCTFLRTYCHIKILNGAKKAALAARLRDELLRDAQHAADDADAADAADAVDPADAAANVACQLVAVEPASTSRCLRKRLGRLWRRGAKELWQRTVSSRIKGALKTYTLKASGGCTLLQIRKEIASKVGMSLESGQARRFFYRQLMKHLMSLKPRKYKTRRLDPLLVWERGCMSFEDTMSECLTSWCI